jgi:hypothetical protein
MIEAVVLMLAILVGGAVGGTLAEVTFGPDNNKELHFVATGVAMGTILVALGIFMLPIH